MTDPVLYYYPGADGVPSPSAPCAKVILALKYSGLGHELKPVSGDPRGVSPTGRLPAMTLDGEAISDSVEILDRLEARKPERPFWPENPRERARDRVWEKLANEHLYWRVAYLRWLVPENAARTCALFFGKLPLLLRLAAPTVVTRDVRARAKGQGVGNFPLERVRAEVLKALDTYEAGLGAGPFLEERSEPGRGDFAAAGCLTNLAYGGLTPWAGAELGKRAGLVAYLGRIYEACELPIPKCLGGP
jgi:glutathione S-transferase